MSSKMLILVAIIGLLTVINIVLTPPKEEMCYDDCLSYIKLEQLGACYRGCMFMTQPEYNLTNEEYMDVRILQYDRCSFFCSQYYYGCKEGEMLQFNGLGEIVGCKKPIEPGVIDIG